MSAGQNAALFFAGGALGYLAGRCGHVLASRGRISGPHHWIAGAIVLGIGLAARSPFIAGIGAGLVVSDFNDMIGGKTTQPDKRDGHLWGTD